MHELQDAPRRGGERCPGVLPFVLALLLMAGNAVGEEWHESGAGAAGRDFRAAGAFVVACHEGRPAMLGVLHVRHGQERFALPAGYVDRGESPGDAARRETLEETGYRVRVQKFLGSPPGNPDLAVVLAEVTGRQAPLPDALETVSPIWTDPNRVPRERWRFPGDREWITGLFAEYAPGKCD